MYRGGFRGVVGGLGLCLCKALDGVWRRAGDLDGGFGKYSDTSD